MARGSSPHRPGFIATSLVTLWTPIFFRAATFAASPSPGCASSKRCGMAPRPPQPTGTCQAICERQSESAAAAVTAQMRPRNAAKSLGARLALAARFATASVAQTRRAASAVGLPLTRPISCCLLPVACCPPFPNPSAAAPNQRWALCDKPARRRPLLTYCRPAELWLNGGPIALNCCGRYSV